MSDFILPDLDMSTTPGPMGMTLSSSAFGLPPWWSGQRPADGTGLHYPWPNPPPGLEHSGRFVEGQQYATTGLFRIGHRPHTASELAAIDCIGLDADAADWMVVAGRAPSRDEAKNFMRDAVSADSDALAAILADHRAVVLGHIEAAGIPAPTRLVNSGYGLHIWWWLDVPVRKADAANFNVMRDGGRACADKINALAGWPVMDTAATDTGTRLLRPIGSYNTKGAQPRRVTCCGWSSRRITLAEVEDWVGVTVEVDRVSGKVRKHRPGPHGKRGGSYPIQYADLRHVPMPDGRSLHAWALLLPPGTERQAPAPAVEGRDGKASLRIHHEVDGTVWVCDFARRVSYRHHPTGRTSLVGVDQLPGVEIVGPSINEAMIDTPTDKPSHVAPSSFEADELDLGILPPAAPLVPWEETLQGRAHAHEEERRRRTGDHRGLPVIDFDELDRHLDEMISAAVGEPPSLPPPALHASGTFRFYLPPVVCSRAPWRHSARVDAMEATSTRTACLSYACTWCGPRIQNATRAAAMAVIEQVLGRGEWEVAVVDDLGPDRTLARWAKAAPVARHFLTIARTAQHGTTFILHRPGHRPQPSRTRPSRLDELLLHASMFKTNDRDEVVQAVGRAFDVVDLADAAWCGRRHTVLRGQEVFRASIARLRDGLLCRSRATEGIRRPAVESSDPNRVAITSYESSDQVRRRAEGRARTPTEADEFVDDRSHRVTVRWGHGGRARTGVILAELVEDGEISPVVRRTRRHAPDLALEDYPEVEGLERG